MSEEVDAAVINNIVWCGIVCETHGITATSRKHIWRTTSKSPPYYPDMITSSRYVTVDEVIDIIDNKEITGIKDSFANLDLSPFDFEMLFTADWIYHAPVVNLESIQPGWCHVTTENELADWTSAIGLENVIKPELLDRRDVKIYLNKKKDEVSGFIANLGANVIGISNVFSSANIGNTWSDIHNIVPLDFPGLPMVGYESGTDLTAALKSGWTTVGPLRVWVRSND
ncbi:hypothetical protein BK138_35535 [Paenibacillus rhizosphaerae]|uniref:Uncharacterized protein n=1 Tax=Paenibacillus rhizosphaerae TaxID=297318 RepID=A0A1R1DTZ5_9BACL|nr:hypothetical protein [Paenibacillus rhizosphaerae]OMF42952.1 hypothetical protein BK138_35535 [Paenibacillus rhizosphaerae]